MKKKGDGLKNKKKISNEIQPESQGAQMDKNWKRLK